MIFLKLSYISQSRLTGLFSLVILWTLSTNTWAQKIIRAPYIQLAKSNSVLIRYRTDQATLSEISISTDGKTFNPSIKSTNKVSEHTVAVSSLQANTKYYYRIHINDQVALGDSSYFFKTAPTVGSKDKISIFSVGDMAAGETQRKIYNAYVNRQKSNYTNLFITMGDNIYCGGSDGCWQEDFFNPYHAGPLLRQTALFPSTGNHDYDNQAFPYQQDDSNMAYYQNFTLPSQGELGGIPSNSEAYYSYDYGNVHLVVLDSYAWGKDNFRIFDQENNIQLNWLKEDLKATKQDWKIIYFHFPVYTKGTYDSDVSGEIIKLRDYLTRVFDEYGVDLVMSGHSHVYERSRPLREQYGLSSEFSPEKNWPFNSSGRYDGSDKSCAYVFQNVEPKKKGTTYVVNGCGGQTAAHRFNWPHPVMEYSLDKRGGSMAIDIEDNRLDAKFIDEEGEVLDQFTIFKEVNKITKKTINAYDPIELKASWPGPANSYVWSSGEKSQKINLRPLKTSTYTVTDTQKCLQDSFEITVNPPLGTTKWEELIHQPFESLEIYDLLGRTWKSIQKEGFIDQSVMDGLPTGQYILEYRLKGKSYTLKLIH
ncbi:metallophosphoesterase [Aquirufa rosea]|uniref:Metallophosphoesterase n=1 Tax=Aquirufa rosea TaxID=2509241 RepID=A0A4Q1C2E3_9BACT|nr:metallophosphoesterase [Aquirufa rosea]RXK52434.1 metallophosphoesterase [Aquirufa rosea]